MNMGSMPVMRSIEVLRVVGSPVEPMASADVPQRPPAFPHAPSEAVYSSVVEVALVADPGFSY
jgi:hypothetical protein